jgi:hypothetical protein
MGTVSCCNGMTVNGSRVSKMVAQVLSMGKDPDANPRPLLTQTRNESMAAEQLMKWHINCKLFVVQPMKLSTTGLPSIQCVCDGSKSNSQKCTKRNSACPHTAVHTVETLKKLNFEVLEHPLYRLDLTPLDSPVWST